MSKVKTVESVKLIVGILAAGEDNLGLARERLKAALGAVDGESRVWPFEDTDYYTAEMGEGLLRQFVSLETPFDPGELASVKRKTHGIEMDLAEGVGLTARRSINLDPGLVTPWNLVLATTKNFAHRVYIGQGIYAEVTLLYRGGRWEALPWAYPDYRSGRYDAFLTGARRRLLAARAGREPMGL